jgi:hypothetical protein
VVPTEFGPFFAATAAVSGALIGLLFVAISVAPARDDPAQRVVMDVRAGVAFSALLNTLVVALFALIPGIGLGTTAAIVAAVGLSSCLALGIVLFREEPAGLERRRQVRLLAIQGAVFAYELVVGVQLRWSPRDVGLVQTVCILIIVLFLVGIARAWQLVGARDTGLVSEVARSLRTRGSGRGGDTTD